MDNFMDKLVEKMNVQGQIRTQNLAGVSDAENKNSEMIKALSTKFQENNEKVVELASQYKESIEDSIHKENVRCYRNTQAMVEENMGKLPSQISEGINEKLGTLPEELANVCNDIVDEKIKAATLPIKKKLGSLQAMVLVTIFLSVMNLAALIVILLWIFRIL